MVAYIACKTAQELEGVHINVEVAPRHHAPCELMADFTHYRVRGKFPVLFTEVPFTSFFLIRALNDGVPLRDRLFSDHYGLNA